MGRNVSVTKKGTPTMGGLMILFGVVVSTVLWVNPANRYVWIVRSHAHLRAIGFYDDYLKVTKQTHAGVSGKVRIVIEVLIAAVACYFISLLGRQPFASSLAFPFFKELVLPLGWFFVAFGAFIIVGAGNAVNLTDGLDGLAIVPVIVASPASASSPISPAIRSSPNTSTSTMSPAPASWRWCAGR